MRHLFRWITLPLLLLFMLTGCATEETSDSETMAEDMAAQHEDDTTTASTLVREPNVPVNAQPIRYNPDGETAYIGYMAEPARPDSVADEMGAAGDTTLPAVILIHEWWGLNDNIQTMARLLAGEGYRVLAVDLYGGEVGNTPDEAQALMGQALNDMDQMQGNLQSAYQFLTDRYNAPKVGVMGWCFGGLVSLRTAVALPQRIDATVIYYGRLESTTDEELQSLQMPMLAFFGGQDQSIPVSDVRAFETTLEEAGKDASVYVYDEAGHAFANPTGQNYVEDAATDAWSKTLDFLAEYLHDDGAEPM
ncbi:MAG TPA: dienelactone hydrolase family protein [Rhodothermales bacterium]|nr:dienelactone hydrolase family protein [Rhodothermales bacterium]